MNIDTYLHEGERRLAYLWKIAAARGALAIAFAVVILIWPGIGLGTLIALFGTFALITGASTFGNAFRLPLQRSERVWLALEGLIGVVVGVVVFVWPGLSALALLYAIAAWAIVTGVYGIVLAFAWRIGRRGALFVLGGLFSVAFGVIMFTHPGAIALLALIAAFLLVTGVMQIAFALDVRHVTVELKRKLRPRATAKPVAQG
jgi:uncharacterized membrane protein HdeD (DUF308 family)